MRAQMLITYNNTPSNAKSVGWNDLPEYCRGDVANASKVTHDHVKGLFIFHKAPEQDVNVLLEAFRL